MPSSDWRTPSAYVDIFSLNNPGFAWEYLRRNLAYRKDFYRITGQAQFDTTYEHHGLEIWGLRFRSRPEPTGLPCLGLLAPGVFARCFYDPSKQLVAAYHERRVS